MLDGLPRIAVPTLVVVGSEDAPFLAAADYMTAKIPQARKVVIPGAGHAPNVDQPELFDAELQRVPDRDHGRGEDWHDRRTLRLTSAADLDRRSAPSWPSGYGSTGIRRCRCATGASCCWQSGWAVPSWPRRWHGRGLPAWADELVGSELLRLGAVGIPVGSGTWLAAPTILAHGSDDVRDRLLRPTLTGEQTWCQLFSEPGAGSDLAGLSTSAVLDGDTWVINGQKVWNTSAHHADLGMLLARTDRDVPKHQGITYFVLPMKQPGVEVRQLRQMNFHASFNEVFLTDARIPKDNVIGAVGQGWTAALTTLAYERRFSALRRPGYSPAAGPGARRGAGRGRRSFRHLLLVPAAGRPAGPGHRARAGSGRRRRPGHPPGHRATAHAAPGQHLDRGAGARRPSARRASRCRGIDRQAGGQQHRARVRQGARDDRGREGDADGAGLGARRA